MKEPTNLKPKHTPGPWRHFDSDPLGEDAEQYFCIETADEKTSIAKVERLGDAELIAAAPKLLGAIENFIAYAKAGGSTAWHAPSAQSYLYDMMVAAGEARGER